MLSRITLDHTSKLYTSLYLKGIITAIVTQLPSIMSGLLAIHNTTLTKEDTPLDTIQHSSEDRQHPTEHLITELHTEDQVVQYLSEEAQHHSEEAIMDHSEVVIMDRTEVVTMDLTEVVIMDHSEVGQQVISEEVMVHTEAALAYIRSAEAQEAHQAMEGDPMADLEDHTECNKQARSGHYSSRRT